MVPVYYEFQNSVKLLSGRFAVGNLPYELEGLHVRKPMILSDQVLEKIGTLQIVVDALVAAKILVSEIFTKIPVDSSLSVINEIAKLYHERHCDGIIAVGGGSVIDTS
jgi:alcohol dehydrogenase